MTALFDPTKPVRMVNRKQPVRIEHTDHGGPTGRTIVAIITTNAGIEFRRSYYPDGSYYLGAKSDVDLVNTLLKETA